MEYIEWVTKLLDLLFGRLGALGTLAVAAFAYVAWLLHLEQKEHAQTREKAELLNEKRLLVFEQFVKASVELNAKIDALASYLRRRG